MARQKISEFRAKTLLYAGLRRPYTGLLLGTTSHWRSHLKQLDSTKRYVAKVDEGVKGRHKKGLVALNLSPADIPAAVSHLFKQDYHHVLVEEFREHAPASECYLMIDRTRAGNVVMFSQQGGIEVEAKVGSIERQIYRPSSARAIEQTLGLSPGVLAHLVQVFDDNYFGFLEINPLVVTNGQLELLDAAVEVDGAAASLVAGRWSADDFRGQRQRTPEERVVGELAASSQSSFNLQVLNPNGQVFLLLSGGGASVTLADEVYNQGFGAELANYGEYSGNPTADETYLYATQILHLLLRSPARSKVLVIGGGVANFTDIRVTFSGVIQALQDAESALQDCGAKVFVRRGGPYEADGLAAMQAYLESAGLLGAVAGPEMTLAEIIPLALKSLKQGAAA